jgi:methyl-accepting chemotaxis protein
MPWRHFKTKKFLYDLVPVLFALVVALLYFLSVVPNTRPFWQKYLLAVLGLLILDRIVITWYARHKIMPPIIAYKRGKRAGRVFTRAELEEFYREFAAHVPRSQIMTSVAWVIAATALATISYLWIQRSWIVFFGILFTGIIAAAISLGFAYFLLKSQIRPLIEEVAASLDRLPDVSDARFSFILKIGASVIGIALVAFLSFGVMVYSRLSTELDRFALQSGAKAAQELAQRLRRSPEAQWGEVLKASANPLWVVVPVDASGRVLEAQASGSYSSRALESALQQLSGPPADHEFLTTYGRVRLIPAGSQRYLALLANEGYLSGVVKNLSLAGIIFLIATLVVFSGYILWLGRDTARTLSETAAFNKRLAAGDLTRVPAIWSDDELGAMADDLRSTFQGLGKLVREVAGASAAVDEEVAQTLGVTEGLRHHVTSQAASAERTTQSMRVMEEGMRRVSTAMTQVANSTQEVSSAILQMQASVEEIARNADVLIHSVEKTASSSNEILATAEEVKGATDQLYSGSQEAVSFLNELDASLEETRRNAASLSETAGRVTRDAEAGFTAVAAVEEQILRTRKASEQGRSTLEELLRSIERIGRIVDLIQDVTEQTNLLSLNASIIAAGAGEYGKPFAVVATQIRELSARTAGNAKEIRTVIRSLTESGGEMAGSMDRTFQVVEGSAELSQMAGKALKTILESASSQEENSRRIASATEELAHGGQSANRAMHQIFEMIQGIARATQEQAQSTRYLNEEAEKVREVARQLRNATDEQAKGSRVISEAVTRIMDDSRQTNQAVQLQTQEVSGIYEAMTQVAGTAQAIERAFSQLMEAFSRLQKSSALLRQEVQSFKTV